MQGIRTKCNPGLGFVRGSCDSAALQIIAFSDNSYRLVSCLTEKNVRVRYSKNMMSRKMNPQQRATALIETMRDALEAA